MRAPIVTFLGSLFYLLSSCNNFDEIPVGTVVIIDTEEAHRDSKTREFYDGFIEYINQETDIQIIESSGTNPIDNTNAYTIVIPRISYSTGYLEECTEACDGSTACFDLRYALYEVPLYSFYRFGVKETNVNSWSERESQCIDNAHFDNEGNCDDPRIPLLIDCYDEDSFPGFAGNNFGWHLLKRISEDY